MTIHESLVAAFRQMDRSTLIHNARLAYLSGRRETLRIIRAEFRARDGR